MVGLQIIFHLVDCETAHKWNSFVGCQLNGLLLNNYCMNIKKLWNDLCLQRGKKTYKGKLIEGEEKISLFNWKSEEQRDAIEEDGNKKIIYWFESVWSWNGRLIFLWILSHHKIGIYHL